MATDYRTQKLRVLAWMMRGGSVRAWRGDQAAEPREIKETRGRVGMTYGEAKRLARFLCDDGYDVRDDRGIPVWSFHCMPIPPAGKVAR